MLFAAYRAGRPRGRRHQPDGSPAGATLFFWSRVLFIPVYYAGIVYLRTAVWLASIVGLAMMIIGLL